MVMVAVLSLVMVAWRGDGAERYVDVQLTTGLNDGSSWVNAYTNLQEAIAATGNGTNLWVAQGTYYPANFTDSSSVSNSFRLKTGMTVYGGFTNGMGSLAERDWMEYATILSGDIDRDGLLNTNNSRRVVIPGTNSAVDGCHIMFGYGVNGNKDGCAVSSYISSGVYSSTNFALRNCVIAQNAGYGQNGSQGSVVCSYMAPGQALISNCVFAANICSTPANSIYCYVVMGNYAHALRVKNCLFLRNGLGCSIWRHSSSPSLDVQNCTFFKNAGKQIFSHANGSSTWTVKNSIFWGNADTNVSAGSSTAAGLASYCDIQNSGGSANWQLAGTGTNVTDRGGNLDTDPLFVGGSSGVWTHAPIYDGAAFRTTLTDTGAAFGRLRGKYLNPKSTGPSSTNCFYILSNSATQIVVRGKADAVGSVGNTYEVMDAHLKPKSPCIDAGDPLDAVAAEPAPNGNRINMGAYGGTREAESRLLPGLTLMIQ